MPPKSPVDPFIRAAAAASPRKSKRRSHRSSKRRQVSGRDTEASVSQREKEAKTRTSAVAIVDDNCVYKEDEEEDEQNPIPSEDWNLASEMEGYFKAQFNNNENERRPTDLRDLGVGLEGLGEETGKEQISLV